MASEHTGVVRSVAGGRAVIAVAVAGCSSCGRHSACGIGKLAGGRKETLIEVTVTEAVAPGDVVALELPEGALLGSALAGYLLPAFLMLLGAGLGEALGGDAMAALGALLGLGAGVGVNRGRGGPVGRASVRRFTMAG